MAETNPLTDSMNKILGTTASVGQTSIYTPPDPFAASLAAAQKAYSAPAPAPAPASVAAYTAPTAPVAPGVATALSPLAPRRQARLDQYAQRRGLSPEAARAAYDARYGATPAAAMEPLAPAAAPAASALPWMGYNQYYAGNEAALHPLSYETQYTNEYNQYKDTLPFIYQDLINYGITPESVASGGVTGLARGASIEKIPTDPAAAMALYGNATTPGSISDARYKG